MPPSAVASESKVTALTTTPLGPTIANTANVSSKVSDDDQSMSKSNPVIKCKTADKSTKTDESLLNGVESVVAVAVTTCTPQSSENTIVHPKTAAAPLTANAATMTVSSSAEVAATGSGGAEPNLGSNSKATMTISSANVSAPKSKQGSSKQNNKSSSNVVPSVSTSSSNSNNNNNTGSSIAAAATTVQSHQTLVKAPADTTTTPTIPNANTVGAQSSAATGTVNATTTTTTTEKTQGLSYAQVAQREKESSGDKENLKDNNFVNTITPNTSSSFNHNNGNGGSLRKKESNARISSQFAGEFVITEYIHNV